MFIFQTCCARVGVGVGVRVRVRKLFRSTSFKNSLSDKCGGDFHKTLGFQLGFADQRNQSIKVLYCLIVVLYILWACGCVASEPTCGGQYGWNIGGGPH